MTLKTALYLYNMYVDSGRQELADDIAKQRPAVLDSIKSKEVVPVKSKKEK